MSLIGLAIQIVFAVRQDRHTKAGRYLEAIGAGNAAILMAPVNCVLSYVDAALLAAWLY